MRERNICAAAHKRMQNSLFRALRHSAAPNHSPRQIGGSVRARRDKHGSRSVSHLEACSPIYRRLGAHKNCLGHGSVRARINHSAHVLGLSRSLVRAAASASEAGGRRTGGGCLALAEAPARWRAFSRERVAAG